MKAKEKNLLDLQHSLYSTKASVFFSIGIGGAIALFFGIKEMAQEGIVIPILISLIWLIIFAWFAIAYFNECNKIHRKILSVLKAGKN